MGDPRKIRKKYFGPAHPWQKTRIEEEKAIQKEYGTKNKKEIWKLRSLLKNFKDQAKNLIALSTPQAEKEKRQLIDKLKRYGLLKEDVQTLDPILDITLRDILERRLQTQVYKKGLARSINQARQFIVHGHIRVGEKSITSPSYLLTVEEEGRISFSPSSTLNDINHPERMQLQKAPQPKKEEEKEGKEIKEISKDHQKKEVKEKESKAKEKKGESKKTEKPLKKEKKEKKEKVEK